MAYTEFLKYVVLSKYGCAQYFKTEPGGTKR